MYNLRVTPRLYRCIGLLLLSMMGCARPSTTATLDLEPAAPPWFKEITAEAGLDFVHDAGPGDGRYFLPQIIGSGAALFDFDNDGRLDILLLQNGGPNSAATHRLFHQEADGHFRDVSAGSGLNVAGHGMGVAIGDANNDGWPDVLITQFRGVRLFLNNGNGTFTDVTAEAGLDSPLWGTSASFVDYDRDGWLDLVVVNYLDYDASIRCADAAGRAAYCHPSTCRGAVTKLYRNLGAKTQKPGSSKKPGFSIPHFEDVTLSSGLGRIPGPGLGVVCADFNGDGWPDIFIANDDKPNHLWINQRNGTFKEEAMLRGLACGALGTPQGNMGVALGDVDGDCLFDVFVTHLTEETHTLWMQRPRGLFQDATIRAGLTAGRWRGTGFGTVLADFDHDGALDLALVNGRVARHVPPRAADAREFWQDYVERNQLFTNDGSGRFSDISLTTSDFCGRAEVARGLACGDVDGDGALDLLVTNVAGPARLFKNVAPKRGHWLLVRAVDPALGGRDAYGATITVSAGGRKRVGWINPGQSYLCSNDPRAHFGLGAAGRVDAITVLWPDGYEETFSGCTADQKVTLRRGEGCGKGHKP
jgi:hypothetical protein